MNINWNVTHAKDNSISYCMFSNLGHLTESIRACGKVIFSVRKHTKTTLFIEIFSGDRSCPDLFAVCHVPKGAEDLKYHKASSYNPFDGVTRERHYLKVSAKQRLPELKRYLEAILEEILPGMESLETEIVIHGVPELEE